jgi:tetratricopeptide (TPR) repeat protein
MDLLKQIEKRFPKIIPFEEDDFDWANEGYDALKAENYSLAEEIFGKLTLSQPNHHDGFEGLAYTCYVQNLKDEAIVLFTLALEKAKEFLEDQSIDIEVIDEMEENLSIMKADGKLKTWWN